MMARIFRFSTHDKTEAYVAVGWVNTRSLEGTHHGTYATVLEWPHHDRPPEEPEATEVPLAG